jgi:hypothetical protein
MIDLRADIHTMPPWRVPDLRRLRHMREARDVSPCSFEEGEVADMNLEEFLRALHDLSAADIAGIAAAMRCRQDRGDDVDWWQATLLIDRSVRRQRRSVAAAAAAAAARRAVAAAAARAGLAADARDVADTARSAADVARALVAEDASADPCFFLRGWEPIMNLPPWAACDQGRAA